MDTTNLSPGAQWVLDEVIGAMQNAEEMGGTDGTDDYVALMERIKGECDTRIAAARANAAEDRE